MKVANRIPWNSLAAGLERNDSYRRRTECPKGGPSEKKGVDRVMVDVEWHIWKELIYVFTTLFFFSFLKFPYHDKNVVLKIINNSGSEKSSESPPLTKDISGRGIRR